MTDDPKQPSGILNTITGKIGKITAVCVALTAFLGALVQLTGLGKTVLSWMNPPVVVAPLDLRNCLDAQLSYPDAVPLSKWSSMEMRLRGQNDCKATLAVYVTFRGREDRVRLEPPFGDTDPSCWEQKTLASGALDWKVSPPRLVPLKVPLGNKVRVDINWVVYNAETKMQVRADTASFWLEDDHPPGTTDTGSTVPL